MSPQADGSRNGSKPVLVAVDDDATALARIEHELLRRYEPDYRVECVPSGPGALELLRTLRNDGEDVAVVLADQWMPGLTGVELLTVTRELHPLAKRGLLVDWGAWADRPTADAILGAMALGRMDYYVLKPWRSPDELFHRTIAEFLHEWARARATGPRELVVVGAAWSPRTHEVRSLLTRNGVPHVFHSSDTPAGAELLREAGHEGEQAPVVLPLGGPPVVNPSNAELAAAYGVRTTLDGAQDFDVIVIGAGPAGLASAVYGASEGLRTLVVEREAIGGQAGSSSLIRNYLGFSRGVSGAELAQRAFQQAWVFGARFLLMREVSALRTEGDRHVISLPGGEASAPAVILATGVRYRLLGVPELEPLVGAGVFYGASVAEAHSLAGLDVVIVGGGNSAGQAATHLSRYARRVTLLVRGPSLAATMSQYLLDEIEASSIIDVRTRSEVVGGGGDGRLERVVVRNADSGATETLPAAGLFVMIGAVPRTEWLPDSVARDAWGYLLAGPQVLADEGGAKRWPLERLPLASETSAPGIFAVGDARHRSVKRVASAVGEGSVVISQVHEYLAGRGAPESPAVAAPQARAAERTGPAARA